MIDPTRKGKLVRLMVALQGTDDNECRKMRLYGLYPLTEEEQEFMDDTIFRCPECGYWFHTDDCFDGQCEDCYQEELRDYEEEEEEEEDWDD